MSTVHDKKYGLLGAGKTGSKVLDLLNDSETAEVFNTSNPPTLKTLKSCAAIISFLPGPAFVKYLELLFDSGIPVITGSTGFDWPKNFSQRLTENKLTWIRAHNFAIGMNLIKPMIEILSQAGKFFQETHYSIHEVHHIHKLDAPSGTAISWKDWLCRDPEIKNDQEIPLTSERIGDVVGDHELTLETPFEKIKLFHQSKNRKIFASGALWATRTLLTEKFEHGLLDFEKIAASKILTHS